MGRDKWVGVVMFVLALGYLAGALLYPMGSVTNPGPGFFPLVVGIVWSILSGAVVFQRREGGAGAKGKNLKISPEARRAVTLVAGVAVFILVLPLIGYLVSSMLLTFLLMKVLGTGGLARPALYSAAWGVATYLLFIVIMKIPISG